MNLTKAKTIALGLFKKFGLDDWSFSFDNSKKRFGRCNFILRKISISKNLTRVNEEKHFLDTLLHEIAHALVGIGNKHNDIWKSKAIEVGCNPSRTYAQEVISVKGKYKLTCPSCKKVIYNHRVSTGKPACRDCCNKYNFGNWSEKYMWKIKVEK